MTAFRNAGIVAAMALVLGAPGLEASQKKPVRVKAVAAGRAKAASAKSSKGKAAAKSSKGKAAARPAVESKAVAAEKAAVTERTIRLNSDFVATAQLRPMAQQLTSSRSAGGYAGVMSYAQQHPGVQAATAYLSLGHAYMLDHRFSDAGDAFRKSGSAGELSDYSDYLGAQALVQANRQAEAFPLLEGFAGRHPESIFDNAAPLLLANAYLAQKNGAAAVKALEPLQGTPVADHADYRYALARAYQASGDNARAIGIYRTVFTQQPLAYESNQAMTQLQSMGQMPTAGERKLHADAMFNAKHYNEAATEYAAIRNDASLGQDDRDALKIYMAGCDLKLKHLGRRDAEALPSTTGDTAALKLYLLAEISRTEKDRAQHQQIIQQMVQQFPQSRWLEEALYSGGNMYLLTHDMTQAIYHYQLLVERFPNSVYAPSAHWRDAWMNYRLRKYPEAARLMDEQVVRYGVGIEASSALYWRGRIYEDQDKNFAQAANYYRALTANYANFYYGILAKQRLAVLGNQATVAPAVALSSVRKLNIPDLASVVPEHDPHVIKARLLANAALNEYIGPELNAAQGSAQWSALAQAQIYASFGETTRALQSMKKSGISFFALPTSQVPTGYWEIMFPHPYWQTIQVDAAKQGLDPYFVASLIRQESEFNAGAVSPAHAYGLMQLLPSVGKEDAKREGMKGFTQGMLLDPAVNIELGTYNLRKVMDRFGGQPEYALAAYNAGDVPVRQWMASGDYKDIAEFVESIPYTETREYVQAILRNREMYRALYPAK